VNGKVHIHVVLGREGNEALAGHLHWAKVDTFFVHAYTIPLVSDQSALTRPSRSVVGG
jgi:predicted DNA-binding protein with PD1-like motif